jgi:hypothetical protein
LEMLLTPYVAREIEASLDARTPAHLMAKSNLRRGLSDTILSIYCPKYLETFESNIKRSAFDQQRGSPD